MARTTPIIDAAPSEGPVILDDGQIDQAIALAERGIVTNSSSTLGRRRQPDVLPPKERDETPTLVVCVVDSQPWTEEGPIYHREKREIPRWIADLMAEKGQVVIV